MRLEDLPHQLDLVRTEIRRMERRLGQYHLQLGRLARVVDKLETEGEEGPRLSSRAVPVEPAEAAAPPWESVGGGIVHPDPEGREWSVLERCPVCGHDDHTLVNPWNKLLLLEKAPDGDSARYDFCVCHACGMLFARRRPVGTRHRFLLEHFGEITAKVGGGREIRNRVLNPYPLSEADREELRRLAARGVFVSEHLGVPKGEYLTGLARDRFESSVHVDLIGTLLEPRRARVLEVRPKTGAMLHGLQRYWNADVYAMPIWESQQLLVQEVYGIPATAVIDFDRFRIPFDEPFDLIVCQHMLTHVIRPDELFAELRRCLKPGGHVYLHNEPDDIEFLRGNQSMIATLNPLHLQAFDQASLVRGLAANGFETRFLMRRHLVNACLARLDEEVRMKPLTAAARNKRIERYRKAYDRAVLKLDDRLRARVGDEWSQIVAHAVASGVAEFDKDGRLRLVAAD